ncbi:MAG: polysaccharide biosynthesis C-terminal domain-containing protein [Chitinophagales bacterium]
MNPLKKLASQTAIYGIPSIAGRFLFFLLTYLYTRVFSTGQFGINSEFYAYSGFFTVLLAFGMETGFFRFHKDAKDPLKVYSTTLNFIIGTSSLFLVLIYLYAQPIADILKYPDHVEYIKWFGWMLALDAVCAIPFVKLRAENRAAWFATVKVLEIALNFSLNVFFLIICRKAYLQNPDSFLASLYNPAIGVGYIFIANLAASAFKMVLLLPQFRGALNGFDKELFSKLLRYSLPMVLIGFAGIINEMLDRMILKYTLPYDTATNLAQLGIYSACYKISIIMSLFIQAYRFAAEPFFFAQSNKENAKRIYADVLKYFTIFCVFIFLLVMLYLHWFQYFIGKEFRVGLKVVPILLIANLCLGIYTNLSIWYKLTDRTLLGAFVSLSGAALTVILNLLFIPTYGYMASAWATLACYGSMALASYALGQKYYPVNYDLKKIGGFIALGIGLWLVFEKVTEISGVSRNWTATLFMVIFLGLVYLTEVRSTKKPAQSL